MSEDTDNRTGNPASTDEAAALLAELRVRVEEASEEIDRLTAELLERTRALDELESVADALLEEVDTPVILVGDDRRVRAMSRGAADLLEVSGSHVGRALSTVLPDDLLGLVGDRLDGEPADAGATDDEAVTSDDEAVTVRTLADGGALLVLRRP